VVVPQADVLVDLDRLLEVPYLLVKVRDVQQLVGIQLFLKQKLQLLPDLIFLPQQHQDVDVLEVQLQVLQVHLVGAEELHDLVQSAQLEQDQALVEDGVFVAG
jgi:hypothetical protein